MDVKLFIGVLIGYIVGALIGFWAGAGKDGA